MINIPTVLILGAGASKPYNYPTGQELLINIIKSFNKRPEANDSYIYYNKAGYNEKMVNDYINAMKYSGQSSVDLFLERRQEFKDIGKFSIAHQLIQKEHRGTLFNLNSRSESWYQYLFNKMNSDFNSFGENKISIITFNYDRSLEQYLFVALSNTYGYNEERISKQLNKIKIIHVHGKLENLPWEGQEYRKYHNTASWEKVKKASTKISIVSEDIDKYPAFKEAHNLLLPAQRIIFLGFGYNETNMRRLRIQDLTMKDIIGTGYGIGAGEKRLIQNTWKKQSLSIQDMDIIRLFREWMPLE